MMKEQVLMSDVIKDPDTGEMAVRERTYDAAGELVNVEVFFMI